MRYVCAVLFCMVGLLPNLCAVSAQELGAESSLAVASQKTIVPAESRFEIIQTNSNIRVTLKLDKYAGTVYELVKTKDLVKVKDEEYVWSVTKRIQHPLDKTDSPSVVNYQITTSAVGVRYTFLININTGATWKLAADPDKEQSYWYPIKSQ